MVLNLYLFILRANNKKVNKKIRGGEKDGAKLFSGFRYGNRISWVSSNK